MIARLLIAAAAASIALPAAVAQPSAAAAQRDWSRTVSATAEGGFRMGNPDARVKIVEYVSMTCNHCAAFARDGLPPLIRDHVRSGRVSLEYRNFVLNIVDAAAALLARCGGPDRFFAISGRMFATQEQWAGRINGLDEAQRGQLAALGNNERLARLAESAGLPAIAAQHGVSAEQGRRCLTDEAALTRLAQMFQTASAAGVAGTPTFLINGTRVDATDWNTLQPLIRRAGG